MIDVEKCEINVTVGNSQNLKCEIKVLVNVKMKGVETVKFAKVLYVPQAVKKFLSVSRIVTKGATTGATQEKMITKKMTLV